MEEILEKAKKVRAAAKKAEAFEKNLKKTSKKLNNHNAIGQSLQQKILERAKKGTISPKSVKTLEAHLKKRPALEIELESKKKKFEEQMKKVKNLKEAKNTNLLPSSNLSPKKQQQLEGLKKRQQRAKSAYHSSLNTLGEKSEAHNKALVTPGANTRITQKELNESTENAKQKLKIFHKANKDLQKATLSNKNNNNNNNNIKTQFINLSPANFMKYIINTNRGFRSHSSVSNAQFISTYSNIIDNMLGNPNEVSPRKIYIVSNIITNIFNDYEATSINIPILDKIIQLIEPDNNLLLILIKLMIDQICLMGLKKNPDYENILESIQTNYDIYDDYIKHCLANNAPVCLTHASTKIKSTSSGFFSSSSKKSSIPIKLKAESIFTLVSLKPDYTYLMIIRKDIFTGMPSLKSITFTLGKNNFTIDGTGMLKYVNIIALKIKKSYFEKEYNDADVPDCIFAVISESNSANAPLVYIWNGYCPPITFKDELNKKNTLCIIKNPDIIEKEMNFIKFIKFYADFGISHKNTWAKTTIPAIPLSMPYPGWNINEGGKSGPWITKWRGSLTIPSFSIDYLNISAKSGLPFLFDILKKSGKNCCKINCVVEAIEDRKLNLIAQFKNSKSNLNKIPRIKYLGTDPVNQYKILNEKSNFCLIPNKDCKIENDAALGTIPASSSAAATWVRGEGEDEEESNSSSVATTWGEDEEDKESTSSPRIGVHNGYNIYSSMRIEVYNGYNIYIHPLDEMKLGFLPNK